MPENKDLDEKKPGEKPPGKFHFNRGNMSGKRVKLGQTDVEQKAGDNQQKKQSDAELSNRLCRTHPTAPCRF
jgi:hypothetical protein